MFNFLLENEPQFYSHEQYYMHLTFSAETVKNGKLKLYIDIR
jgi:hypothetical protein